MKHEFPSEVIVGNGIETEGEELQLCVVLALGDKERRTVGVGNLKGRVRAKGC